MVLGSIGQKFAQKKWISVLELSKCGYPHDLNGKGLLIITTSRYFFDYDFTYFSITMLKVVSMGVDIRRQILYVRRYSVIKNNCLYLQYFQSALVC